MFASNREGDTLLPFKLDSVLPVGNLDLWFYDTEDTRSKKLLRLTNTPHADERSPMAYDNGHFAYLSDANGIRNRFAGYLDSIYWRQKVTVFYSDSVAFDPKYDFAPYSDLIDSVWREDLYRDSAVVFPLSDYARNLRSMSIAPDLGLSADLFHVDGKAEFYLHRLPGDLADGGIDLRNTAYRDYTEAREAAEAAEREAEEQEKVEDFWFQSEFPEVELKDPEPTRAAAATDESGGPARDNITATSGFRRTLIRPYRVKYATEQVLTQLDNSLFVNKYQSFRAGGGQFEQPNLSGLFTVSITDLFEDYRWMGGFRLPTSFSGSEYFLSYTDYSKRLDWRLLYYYKSDRQLYDVRPIWNDPLNARVKENISTVTLTWPLDVIRSIRGHFTYRNDKIQFLAADIFSLNIPNEKQDWVSAKIEYVHDNTIELGTNLLEGMRWKAWYEMHKGFQVNVGGGNGFQLSFDDGFLGVVGLDWRHYQRVHRNIIWANRFAYGMSFGSSKLIYYLGGVDSWIAAQFNTETVIDFEQNYAFQTLATNMRGFQQNIRNGSAYAVVNSELRVPIFAYLVNKPIRSEIIRNFQVVGFFDLGSAWHGLFPFDDENRFNTEVIVEGPITTTVDFFQNPLVAGYGFGARTLLFGYFLRFDMAWGLDTGEILDPLYYFSLSLDF